MNIYTAYCFELNSLGVLQSSRRISRDGWESSKNTKISFLDFWLYGKGGEWCQIFPATPFRFFIFFHNDNFFGFSCIGGELLRGRKRKWVFYFILFFYSACCCCCFPPYIPEILSCLIFASFPNGSESTWNARHDLRPAIKHFFQIRFMLNSVYMI
jgi:hypothetical protein